MMMQNILPHNATDPVDEQVMEDVNVTINLSEEKDRKNFTQEIHKFMAEIGKPLSKIPIMGYKELDLFQLYKEVTAHGGFNEVVKNVGTWSKIWKRLGNFDPSITDSSFRLKKNYERYLLEYEYKVFPEHRAQALEFQDKSSMKRSSSNNSLHTASNVPRPHSPTSISSSILSNSSFSLSNSNTSSGTFHSDSAGSPTFTRKIKPKKKRISKSASSIASGSKTPSRSNSYNNFAIFNGKMPLVIGDLTIESLGTVVPRAPYVTEKHVYPVGFVSHRLYTSRVNPDKQVRYTSMIVDAGDRPQFIVVPADEPEQPIISNESPSECWRVVLQHFLVSNDHDATTQKLAVSGHLRFGLTQPDVAGLIRDLPNADRVLAMFPPASPSKRKYSSDDSEEDTKIKARKYSISRSASSSSARDDVDDLDSAIATLQALKYCSVF